MSTKHGEINMDISSEDVRVLHERHPTYTYGKAHIVKFHPQSDVSIGKFCSIAKNVTILAGGEHDTTTITTYPFHILMNKEPIPDYRQTKGPVVIGNDVWIGYGATILSGVTIGDGAVIGAGSLISKDVEPYEIVAGNPQRHIRYRFNEEDRERLLRLQWWNSNDETLLQLIPHLLTDNIDKIEQIIYNKK